MNIRNQPCPCHSGRKYKKCCRKLHVGVAAETPARLMRSRYAAYALGLADYIIETTAPDGPQYQPDLEQWRASIALFSQGTAFESLELLATSTDGDEGRVTFRAGLRQRGEDASFTEESLFVRRGGRWLYVDAIHEHDEGA